MKKKILIGLAWPYANGSLHLGHVSGLLGGDVVARYHRLAGDEVLFVSGSDCYGTPIAVEAAEKNIHPNEIANKYHEEFRRTLIDGLKFSYDLYTQTTDKHHIKVVQDLFLEIYEKGYLYTKTEKALYSPFLGRFLPDRFVEGTCPQCGFSDARGDQCDECGALLNETELKNPRINPKILQRKEKISDEDLRLEVRESEHFYLKLSALEKEIEEFIERKSDNWCANAKGFAKSFVKQGLKDRAITRDTDWGIPVPVPGYEGKKIYVWFEAVTGYFSASKLWAKKNKKEEEWKEWWLNEDAVHYYVHGKDNIPFHTIIWPGILLAEGELHTPDRVFASEYLTFEGKQFSKSRKWGVWLPEFLEYFDPETLRFFLIASGIENSDTNFTWEEFAQAVNSQLIGNFGNLVNRTLSFSQKHFPEGVGFVKSLDKESEDLLNITKASFQKTGDLIEKGQFRAAWLEVQNVANNSNRFIDKKEPWNKVKEADKRDELETDLAVLVQVIRSLAILISPFLPTTSEQIFDFLKEEKKDIKWQYPEMKKEKVKVEKVKPLFKKIEQSEVDKQYEILSARKTNN